MVTVLDWWDMVPKNGNFGLESASCLSVERSWPQVSTLCILAALVREMYCSETILSLVITIVQQQCSPCLRDPYLALLFMRIMIEQYI